MNIYRELINPIKVWSHEDIFSKPCPVPKEPGIYAWYFQNIPSEIPAEECVHYNDLALLYIGISPKKPPNNKPLSKQTIYKRIRYHLKGNAEGSTLRLTLGCLLSENLGIQLRCVGSGNRMTFSDGEDKLSNWMRANAFVIWKIYSEPWILEEEFIKKLSLPLNLDKNKDHPFYEKLKIKRKMAKINARKLPILPR